MWKKYHDPTKIHARVGKLGGYAYGSPKLYFKQLPLLSDVRMEIQNCFFVTPDKWIWTPSSTYNKELFKPVLALLCHKKLFIIFCLILYHWAWETQSIMLWLRFPSLIVKFICLPWNVIWKYYTDLYPNLLSHKQKINFILPCHSTGSTCYTDLS